MNLLKKICLKKRKQQYAQYALSSVYQNNLLTYVGLVVIAICQDATGLIECKAVMSKVYWCNNI